MVRRSTLRASDAEREQVAERLRVATAEGRLRAEELEHRLARALRADTYGELDALVADLPRGQVVRCDRTNAIVLRGVMGLALVAAAGLAALVVLLMALWIVSGVLIIWMLWVGVSWAMFGRRVRPLRTMRRSSLPPAAHRHRYPARRRRPASHHFWA